MIPRTKAELLEAMEVEHRLSWEAIGQAWAVSVDASLAVREMDCRQYKQPLPMGAGAGTPDGVSGLP